MKTLTLKDLGERWGQSPRSVQRDVRRWKLPPSKFKGLQPFFNEADVEEMERRRLRVRAQDAGLYLPKQRIITVAEAKRLAGKTGKNGRGK